MFEVLSTWYSKVEAMFCSAPSGSEPSLLLSNDLNSFWFKPVQDDFQRDIARVADEADGSVVLAGL